jgi:DNA-directed RNA polymerase sigma subunit (sigma70/sigma32)
MNKLEELEEKLLTTVNTLRERNSRVLKTLYGLEGKEYLSREETAILFNTTKEGIRQIEARSFRQMMHPDRSKPLREYHRYLNSMKLYSSIYWEFWREHENVGSN